MPGRGSRDRECEAGVVGLRVVQHIGTGDAVARQARHVCNRLVDPDASMAPTDAEPAGEVVAPERGAEQAGQAPVDDATFPEHRDEEGQHPDEVGCVLQRALALVQRLVHEPEIALLEVAEPTVHELRALRRRTRGEVAAFD